MAPPSPDQEKNEAQLKVDRKTETSDVKASSEEVYLQIKPGENRPSILYTIPEDTLVSSPATLLALRAKSGDPGKDDGHDVLMKSICELKHPTFSKGRTIPFSQPSTRNVGLLRRLSVSKAASSLRKSTERQFSILDESRLFSGVTISFQVLTSREEGIVRCLSSRLQYFQMPSDAENFMDRGNDELVCKIEANKVEIEQRVIAAIRDYIWNNRACILERWNIDIETMGGVESLERCLLLEIKFLHSEDGADHQVLISFDPHKAVHRFLWAIHDEYTPQPFYQVVQESVPSGSLACASLFYPLGWVHLTVICPLIMLLFTLIEWRLEGRNLVPTFWLTIAFLSQLKVGLVAISFPLSPLGVFVLRSSVISIGMCVVGLALLAGEGGRWSAWGVLSVVIEAVASVLWAGGVITVRSRRHDLHQHLIPLMFLFHYVAISMGVVDFGVSAGFSWGQWLVFALALTFFMINCKSYVFFSLSGRWSQAALAEWRLVHMTFFIFALIGWSHPGAWEVASVSDMFPYCFTVAYELLLLSCFHCAHFATS